MPEHEKTSITLSFAKMLKISLFQADDHKDQLFESSKSWRSVLQRI
jgi:hypothetical protein